MSNENMNFKGIIKEEPDDQTDCEGCIFPESEV